MSKWFQSAAGARLHPQGLARFRLTNIGRIAVVCFDLQVETAVEYRQQAAINRKPVAYQFVRQRLDAFVALWTFSEKLEHQAACCGKRRKIGLPSRHARNLDLENSFRFRQMRARPSQCIGGLRLQRRTPCSRTLCMKMVRRVSSRSSFAKTFSSSPVCSKISSDSWKSPSFRSCDRSNSQISTRMSMSEPRRLSRLARDPKRMTAERRDP